MSSSELSEIDVSPSDAPNRRGGGTWPVGEMRALVIEPGKISATQVPIPATMPGNVLVQVAYLGICHTDVELLENHSYYIDQKLNEYPLVFGHEWTGTVVATGEGVDGLEPGDPVIGQTVIACGACGPCQAGLRSACERHLEVGLMGHDGAAAQYISMPARSVTKLAAGASLRDSVLIEPGVTAMNAVWKTNVRFDDRVVVIGTGTLGLLATALALRITRNVDVVGVEEEGLALARRLGAANTLAPSAAQPDSYTVAIEASGHPDSVASLGRILKPGGRGALVGIVNRGVPDFIPAFISLKDITLYGVLHGLDHYGRVAEFIADGFDADALIDRVLPWTHAHEAFQRMIERKLERPKVLLDFATIGQVD